MTTKERLLRLLEENKGSFYSGEEIAKRLEVSRTAVWKAVKALQAEGYEIDAVQNKGYSLAASSDILSAAGIQRLLDPQWQELELHVLPTVESTNALLRERANAGAGEGYVILAGSQTKGRGRLGRSFYSPADSGLYLSLLLRPAGWSPAQAVRVTTMAAVAACQAIEAVSGREAAIKWVNDIFMDGRKVSGILTEGSFNLEIGSLDYIILGIGINLYPPDDGFPADISATAGAVFPQPCSDGKNRMAAEFLNRFMEIYRSGDLAGYRSEYRRRSFILGKRVGVLTPEGKRPADALDVDGDCRLLVRYEDGTVEQLSSAEVSVRV